MEQQCGSTKHRKNRYRPTISLKTPQDFELSLSQDFELRKPVVTASEVSVPRTSSFVSLSQSSSTHLIDQSDQFFIVPGVEGALSREEFSKLTPAASPEKSRNSEASFTEMAAARQSLSDLAQVARRKEQEWRTLQELRIRGLEDAVQGREQSLQQERRRFQRTFDEMAQQKRQLETQLTQSGASRELMTQLTTELDAARASVLQLTQEKDEFSAKLTDITAKHEAVELAATKLREENEQLGNKYQTLENEGQASRRSNDWLTKRLQHAEEERERSASSELHTKVTMGKIQGYLKEEENLLQVARAELNKAKEAKETIEFELAAEKQHVKIQSERALKQQTEWAVSRSEFEEKLSDKTKKIDFLVQGIKTLETDWKERYRELQDTSSGVVDELQRSHSSEQERLLTMVRNGEERQRQATQQASAAQADCQRLHSELESLRAAEADARREMADERREAARLLAERDLQLAELRGRVQRQALQVDELSGRGSARDSAAAQLEQTRRLLAQWQTACAKLRAYAERVTAERDRLCAAQPVEERDSARLRVVVRRLRDELEEERRRQGAAASPHCSSCSSAEDARALQIRQLLLTNAKLNETIEEQCETVRSVQSQLARHRTAARSTQFLRQETAYLRSLLEGGGDEAAASASASASASPSASTAAAAEATEPTIVRELRYKLQLAARYIAQLGRERTEAQQRQRQLEERLSAAQRGASLPDSLDKLRLSRRAWSRDSLAVRSDGGAASFAELLDQLNSMQVESGAGTGDTGTGDADVGVTCRAATQTTCRHVLSGTCRHGRVAGDADKAAHVPRLVGVGDIGDIGDDGAGGWSAVDAGDSTEDPTSSATIGTGDALSAGEVAPSEGRRWTQPRSRSVPHTRQHGGRHGSQYGGRHGRKK